MFSPYRPPVPLIALLALLAAPLVNAAEGDGFERGLDAYANGEYAAAAEAFREALAETPTAPIHHNLALALARMERPGEAVWHLERAVRLAPHEPRYAVKLAALRERLGLPPEPPAWWRVRPRVLPLNGWLGIASIAFVAGLAAWLLPRAAGWRVGLGTRLLRGFAVLALAAALAAAVLIVRDHRAGVVTGAEATLRAAPAEAGPATGTARRGQRADRIGRHGDFVRVETETGASGWLPAQAFRPLRPGPHP